LYEYDDARYTVAVHDPGRMRAGFVLDRDERLTSAGETCD